MGGVTTSPMKGRHNYDPKVHLTNPIILDRVKTQFRSFLGGQKNSTKQTREDSK